jgi:cytochrome c oxidase subunit 1
MNDTLGKLHFWLTFIGMNGVFMPMFWLGLAGVSRRLYDGGASYAHAQHVLWLNGVSSWSAWAMGVAQLLFIVNFFWSMRGGEKVDRNPWHATTLEWEAPSPPPHGNFEKDLVVCRGPYDYSPRGYAADFRPQAQEA